MFAVARALSAAIGRIAEPVGPKITEAIAGRTAALCRMVDPGADSAAQ